MRVDLRGAYLLPWAPGTEERDRPLSCLRHRPAIQTSRPLSRCEAELSEPTPGPADLPLIRVQPVREVGVCSSNTPGDLEEHPCRQRAGLDGCGLRGQSASTTGRLLGGLDDP